MRAAEGLLGLLSKTISSAASGFLHDKADDAVLPGLQMLLNLGADAVEAGGPLGAAKLFEAVEQLGGKPGKRTQAIFAMAAEGHDLSDLVDQLQDAEAAEKAAVNRAAADLGKVFRQVGEFLLKVATKGLLG